MDDVDVCKDIGPRVRGFSYFALVLGPSRVPIVHLTARMVAWIRSDYVLVWYKAVYTGGGGTACGSLQKVEHILGTRGRARRCLQPSKRTRLCTSVLQQKQ